MFSGKGLVMGWFHGNDQCDPMVVVAMMMPVSDSKFTLGDGIVHELSEFGGSVVFSGGHAILG